MIKVFLPVLLAGSLRTPS